MTDLRIIWDATNGRGDLNMLGPVMEVGHDLETAVLVSLFTDARAPADYMPTDGTTDRRGWWGDTYNADDIGSLIWTFARAKKTQDTLNNVQDAARKALQWLIDDGVAATIDIAAAWVSKTGLGLGITIHKPGELPSQFSFVWDDL